MHFVKAWIYSFKADDKILSFLRKQLVYGAKLFPFLYWGYGYEVKFHVAGYTYSYLMFTLT